MWRLFVVIVLFMLCSRASKIDRTVELQDARIKQLEQSELQMRGWFQPPDTVFVERKGEGI